VDEETLGRKAIVLITDGVDNASEIPRLRATWMARRVAVPIYTLGFIPMREKLLASRAREALRVSSRSSEGLLARRAPLARSARIVLARAWGSGGHQPIDEPPLRDGFHILTLRIARMIEP